MEVDSCSLKNLFASEDNAKQVTDSSSPTIESKPKIIPKHENIETIQKNNYKLPENKISKKPKQDDRFECVKEPEMKAIFLDIDKAQNQMKLFEGFLLRLYRAGHLKRIYEWRDINYMAIHTDLRKYVVQIIIYFMNFMGEDTIPSWLVPPNRKKKHCKVFLEMVEEAKISVVSPTNTDKCGQKRQRMDEDIIEIDSE